MRWKTIFVLVLLIAGFALASVKSDKSLNYFDQWRPGVDPGVCHAGGTNEEVSGSIFFNSSWITVEEGDTFAIAARVVEFGEDITSSDNNLSIGFNAMDEDNGKFTNDLTIYETHLLNTSGYSVLPYIATFTAPNTPGNYSLVVYAVAGSTADLYFYWIRGQVRVEVIEASGPKPPKMTLEDTNINSNWANFTFDIIDPTGIKQVELSIDGATYQEITLENDNTTYKLDVSTYAAGDYTVTFRVTNNIDLSIVIDSAITIPEPVTSSVDTTSTTESQTTVTKSNGDGNEDPGLLGNIVSVVILLALFIGVFWTPILLRRRS